MADCTHCGKELRPDDKFCQYCGQQVNSDNDNNEQPAYAGVSSTPLEAPHSYSSPLSQPSAAASSAPRSPTGPLGATQEGKARLVVRVSPTAEPGAVVDDGEREFTLDGRDIAVGRAPSCDIVLAGDQLASRRHALFRFKDSHCSIVDLGSSNGTYINDQEIHSETELRDGDRITIGGHDLTFSTTAAGPSASLPVADLDSAEAPSPLLETAPSLSVVNMPIPLNGYNGKAAPASEREPDESPADALIVAAPAEAEPEIANGANPQEDVSAVETEDMEAVADDAKAPAQPEANEQSASVSALPASESADLEALREQLAEVSTALARRADEEYRLAGRLRAALVEVRDQLNSLLRDGGAGSYEASSPSEHDYSELVTLARQAAESPLDHLTTFVRHAGEIADALEAAQVSHGGTTDTGNLLAGLEALKARLDETLG